MKNAAPINEQLRSLLAQYETGAINQARYRELRNKIVDGFAIEVIEATRVQKSRDEKPQTSGSPLAIVFTLILVVAAAVLIVFNMKNDTSPAPTAQNKQPVLVDDR